MMRILCFSFFSFFVASTLFAQNSEKQDSILTQEYIAKATSFYVEDVDSCILYTEKIVQLFRKNKRWNETVFWTNVISSLSYSNEYYTTFEKHINIAIKDAEIHLKEGNKNRVDAMNNMGLFFKINGNYKKAILSYKKSIEESKKGNPSKQSLIVLYQNISAVYRDIGDYDEAITYLNEALLIQIDDLKEETKLPLAKTYLDLALLYRDKSLFGKAKFFNFKSEKILKSIDLEEESAARDYLILSHQTLSRIYLVEENTDSSFFHIQKALQFQNKEFQSREISSQEILGDIYLDRKQFQKAISSFQIAHQLARQHFTSFEKKDVIARTLKKTAYGYLKNKNLDAALQNYQKALIALSLDFEEKKHDKNPIIDKMLSRLEGLEIVDEKSKVLLKRYGLNKNLEDLQSAFINFRFASEIISELRKNFLAAGSKNVLAEKSLSVYEGGIKSAYLLFQQTEDEKYLEAAWDFAELNKARLLEESLQENYAQLAGGLPLDAVEKEQNLKREIDFYKNKLNQEKTKIKNKNKEKINTWSSSLFDLKNEYNKLIKHFEDTYPKYSTLKYSLKNKSIEKIRTKTLKSQNTLLEYFVGLENIYLFCLTKTDLKIIEIKKPSSFSEDITTLRSIISSSPFESIKQFDTERAQFVSLSHQLYQLLLEPVLKTLPKEIESLIIVPDDILAYLPFELLLTKKAKKGTVDYSLNSCEYLFNKYSISYNYSASLLADFSDWTTTANLVPFLGFAPTFGQENTTASRACVDDNVYNLQCNAKEVTSIYNQLDGDIVKGIDANVASFKDQSSNCRILHLATHACIDEKNPDLNKIYFSDNFITGIDLNNLKLNAELAVLSACNTGSGKLVKGEGVMSLSRSFILAGCPSTLMSLWSVDDCTTSDIMIHFYKNIKTGLAKDKALRQAKRTHLASADKVNSHPYYWAAFVQSGNADAMEFSNGGYKLLWLMIFPLLFFIYFLIRKKTQGKFI